MWRFLLALVPSARVLRFWRGIRLKASLPLHIQDRWGNRKSYNSDALGGILWTSSLAWAGFASLSDQYQTILNEAKMLRSYSYQVSNKIFLILVCEGNVSGRAFPISASIGSPLALVQNADHAARPPARATRESASSAYLLQCFLSFLNGSQIGAGTRRPRVPPK